ncbi:restriction endonuclease subunit S [Phocea massiliensis]|uniref:Restriction endonuclease subunit S n=1 Tax=Merdimmobilis hominis TaxID=2897707 RepID=A0A938X8Z2_9FIRM|nr:restriction endonuclease subunit S [Merdimmobilis hominis]MBM6921315.1 restriction endonuclease subunit S [Merdimmobilis hominis]
MVKPGYKQTEIGVIPEDWECCNIEQYGQIYGGGTPSTNIPKYWDGAIAWCTPSDITKTAGKYISKTDRTITIDGLNNSAATLMPNNSILLCTRATIGELKLCSIPMTTNQGFKNIILNGENSPDFLYYLLQIKKDDMYALAIGSTFLELSKTNLCKIALQRPPFPEQQKIATALSDIDALITNLEKLIAKKKAVKQGSMQELLTGKRRLKGFRGDWHDIAIGSFADVYAGGTPSTANPAYWGGDIPWMSSGELNKKVVSFVQGRITQAGLENSSTRIIPAHCVLIGLAGQGKTRGTAAYNTISLCTNQSIAAILPNPSEFDSKFLYYYMDTQYKALRELSDGGGGRGGLTKKLIEEFSVRIPVDLEEQVAIASVFTDIDYEIEKLVKELNKYRGIKSGMMSELLTGRIRLV